MRIHQLNDVFFILNLGNIKIEIYRHFSLILCYFWRQNCLKTSILAFWTTLVNACWPHVCDMTKYILGACKYLSQVPSPQISCPEMQNSSWGVEKTIFFSLQPVDGITTFKCKKRWLWKKISTQFLKLIMIICWKYLQGMVFIL